MPTDRPRPPSVERLLAAVRPLVTDGVDPDAIAAVARDVVADERTRLAAGEAPRDLDCLAGVVRDLLDGFADPSGAGSGLTPVLNATGVILHTNLGRAPWAAAAIGAKDSRRYAAAHRRLYTGRLWINLLARSAVLHPRLTTSLLRLLPNERWILGLLTTKVVRL